MLQSASKRLSRCSIARTIVPGRSVASRCEARSVICFIPTGNCQNCIATKILLNTSRTFFNIYFSNRDGKYTIAQTYSRNMYNEWNTYVFKGQSKNNKMKDNFWIRRFQKNLPANSPAWSPPCHTSLAAVARWSWTHQLPVKIDLWSLTVSSRVLPTNLEKSILVPSFEHSPNINKLNVVGVVVADFGHLGLQDSYLLW